jgi:hypothetical protein
MRIARRSPSALLAIFCGLWLAVASCAHTMQGGSVSFRVDSNVPDATIWIDDVLVGKVSDWARDGRNIRAGFHRVEVRSPGYYSVYQEIEQPDGGQSTVKADLKPLLD